MLSLSRESTRQETKSQMGARPLARWMRDATDAVSAVSVATWRSTLGTFAICMSLSAVAEQASDDVAFSRLASSQDISGQAASTQAASTSATSNQTAPISPSPIEIAPIEIAPIEIAPMVVAATRVASPLADAPVRTLVMEGETIQRLHSRDIRDALRMLPGIQLREIHGKTGEEVQLQGLSGDRVLILVDGLPVSATTGSTVDTSQLGALDIAQIEVIPGAASALYGSAAMGGVVNIVTQKPQSSSGGRLALQGGSFGSERELSDAPLSQRHLVLSGHTTLGDITLHGAVDQRISSEFDLDPSTYPTQGFDGTKTQYKLGIRSALNAADGETSAPVMDVWQWQLDAEHYAEDLTNRRVSNAGFYGTKTETLSRQRLSAQAQRNDQTGQSSMQALFEQQSNDTAQLNNDASVPAGNLWRESDYQQQKLVNQRQQALGLWGAHRMQWVGGLEAFAESLSQRKSEIVLTSEGAADNATVTAEGDYFRTTTPEVEAAQRYSLDGFISVLATQERHGGSVLEWSPGLRLQHDSHFGAYATPTLNARQKWPLNSRWQLQLRESVGQGYRVPNLKDRYYVFDHSVNGYMVLGNPDLTPEHSYSGQFSATLTDQQSWNLELSAFVNRLYDLIEAEHSGEFEDNGRVAIYRYSNVEDARTAGAEIALQYSHPRVTLRASYGYLNAVDLGTDLPLLNRAPHHAKGMVTTFLTPAWDATLTWDWQNGMATNTSDENDIRYSRALARLDLKTGYQVRPDLLLFAGINNLTDNVRDSADAYDRRPSEGRFPYLGLDLSF